MYSLPRPSGPGLSRRFSLTVIKALDVRMDQAISTRNRLYRPGHKEVIVLGGGQSGATLINRIVTNGGFSPRTSAVIDSNSYTVMKEGLDLLAHDLMDQEDIQKTILARIHPEAAMFFEEVVYFDPKNNHLGTFDGSDMTFDYCVLAPGQKPDYSSIDKFEPALADKFARVVASQNISEAIKMKQRLDGFKPKEVIVYKGGTPIKNFQRSINHALIFKHRFPKASVRLIIEDSNITGLGYEADILVADVLNKRGVIVETERVLEEIKSETSASFVNKVNYERATELFDMLYVDPRSEEPRFLTEAGVFSKDFSKESFQHQTYPSLFAQGSYLFNSNSLSGMLEQTYPCTLNLVMQMLFDHAAMPTHTAREALYSGYQKYKLFPTQSTLQYLELKHHELNSSQSVTLSRPNWLKFTLFTLLRYNLMFRLTSKGKNYGRLGYHMPHISSKYTQVRPLSRKLAFPKESEG